MKTKSKRTEQERIALMKFTRSEKLLSEIPLEKIQRDVLKKLIQIIIQKVEQEYKKQKYIEDDKI